MAWHMSDDGKVVDGKIVVFLRPKRSGASGKEGEGPGQGDAAGEGDAADQSDAAEADGAAEGEAGSGGPVRNLRWGAGAAADGDEVEMLADAQDGASVLFTVERRVGAGPWQPLDSVKATASGGTATGKARLEHPGSLADVHFRFRARIL